MTAETILNADDNFSKYSIKVEGGELPPFLERVYERIAKRVIGQSRPIRRAMRLVANFYAKLNDPVRPPGILMLAGPSGVGKTYFAKEFAYALIGDPEEGLTPIVFIDCGSLSLEHTVASLTGAPPGYIGYGQEVGLEQVGAYDKKKRDFEKIERIIKENLAQIDYFMRMGVIPRSVVLKIEQDVNNFMQKLKGELGPFRSVVIFDEIEKASVNIQRQLLSILEEGILRLHNGRTIDFSGAFIIFTTNVGTQQVLEEYLSERTIGFHLPKEQSSKKVEDLNQKIWKRVLAEIWDNQGRYFLPELLGRIGKDGIIVFHALSIDDYYQILDLQLCEVQSLLSGKEGDVGALTIDYTPNIKDFLIKEGVAPEYGARALRSVIAKYVKEPIARRILTGELRVGDKILLDVEYVENKDVVDKTELEPQIIIYRQERPENVVLPLFTIRAEHALSTGVEKKVQEYFDELFDKLGLSSKPSPSRKPLSRPSPQNSPSPYPPSQAI